MDDIRRNTACYFDVGATWTNDIDFYVSHIPPEDRTVLELGCGTGRVLIPLSRHCDFIVGVDHSRAMLAICQEKLQKHEIAQDNAELVLDDITCINLEQKFGLITAPFRVFQNIDINEKVDALFRVIHKHLAPKGFCILNAFNPNAPRDDLLETWRDHDEVFGWEKPHRNGALKHYYRRKEIKKEPLVLYPELIYRYYENEELVDEVSFVPPMRVYYPDEFKEVIQEHGFSIVETWGGYGDEKYGEGPELVIKFKPLS
jgi:ubiquinone/menaquinone biosynthesis C-methylase UbiE